MVLSKDWETIFKANTPLLSFPLRMEEECKLAIWGLCSRTSSSFLLASG